MRALIFPSLSKQVVLGMGHAEWVYLFSWVQLLSHFVSILLKSITRDK